ncbi:conserved exported hypothetical protein [Rubrivivax sp. A210]|uniref:hypothetical protein n=1 Tax=Rubrivivax sp. A210 TaxID=2772301 RepID=UPI00191B7101|nr:hypothetical protein [Rubrivivax sp. A210]CAD5373666.1 conserved exported hypothetical protein [Rubrivivax sp. A210]
MIKTAALATLLAFATLASAQTAPATSAAKKALVAKVLQLQQPGIDAMATQIAEQPARQMLAQAGQALQRVPADKREALARDIEADVRKYAEEATPLVKAAATRLAPGAIGPLLEERFTEDELKQVIALLESPVNRKYQQMGGDMQRALGEKLGAEVRAPVEAKMRALEQTVGKRLGIAPPAAGASAAKK